MKWMIVVVLPFLWVTPLLADDSFYDISPPGKRVDIGGYKLHLNCQGNGSPTIVLDAGLGDWSVHWVEVQEKLKADSRVCSYDRAGYGWSDPGPRPRSSAQIVTELHYLLEKAGEKPPYLLAGHSFGGINMRLFASTYPSEVSGLVLIDASHPESLPYRRDDSGKAPSTTPTNSLMLIQPLEADISQIPSAAIAAVNNSLLHTKSISASRAEYRAMGQSISKLLQAPRMRDVPVFVISRGVREWPEGKEGDAQETAWQKQQEELVGISSQAKHIIASKSGHFIHLKEPQLVADSIKRMVTDERARLAAVAAENQPPAACQTC